MRETADPLLRRAPLYLRIAMQLRDELIAGAHGRKLPREQDLADRFGVGRPTLRQALQTLQEDGLLQARHGLGWLIQHNAVAKLARAASPGLCDVARWVQDDAAGEPPAVQAFAARVAARIRDAA